MLPHGFHPSYLPYYYFMKGHATFFYRIEAVPYGTGVLQDSAADAPEICPVPVMLF